LLFSEHASAQRQLARNSSTSKKIASQMKLTIHETI